MNETQFDTIMNEAHTSLLHTRRLRASNVRDKRDRRWFWVDNVLIEDYASTLGIHALGVYMALAQRAYNQNQQSQISGAVIADLLRIGRTTVTQALSMLEMHQLIDIEEQYDEETRQQLASIYTLLAVENWLLEPTPERKKFVNARRQAGIAKRTNPKRKQKRSARGQKSTPEAALDGNLDDGSGNVKAELQRGLPSENRPVTLPPKNRRYSVTRHTICLRTPYDVSQDSNQYKEQDVEQDVKQDNNKQAQAPKAVIVADESSLELDLAPTAHSTIGDAIHQNQGEAPKIETSSQDLKRVPTVERTSQTSRNSEETPMAQLTLQELKKTLTHFAERRNIKATSDELDALLEKWPAARLNDDQLAPALMGDYECFGLDKPAEAKFARAAAAKNPARLRWFMCAWLGFEEASDAYHERTKHKWSKTRCFFNKWEELEPPSAWLEGELAALRGAAMRQQRETRAQQAKTKFEALTGRQKEQLHKETLEILNEDSGNEYFTRSSDEFFYKREQLLLDDEALQWLKEFEKVGAPCERTLFVEESETEEEEEEADWVMPEQINLEIYVGPLLAEILAGSLLFADVDKRRAVLLEEDEWQAVKDAIEQRLFA